MAEYVYRTNGDTFVSDDVQKLVASVQAYRARNGLPGSGYNDTYRDVTDSIAASYRKRRVREEKERPQPVTFEGALAAAKAAVKVATGDVVDDTELKRRADICHSCPMKSESSGCFGCNASARLASIANLMKRTFGKELRLPRNLKRFNCGVCGCSLSLLLPTKVENLHADTPEQASKRPANCWMK